MAAASALSRATVEAQKHANAARLDADFLTTAAAVLAQKLGTLKASELETFVASETAAEDAALVAELEKVAAACAQAEQSTSAMLEVASEANRLIEAGELDHAGDESLTDMADRAGAALDRKAAEAKARAATDPFAARQAAEVRQASKSLQRSVAKARAAEEGREDEEDDDEDDLVAMDVFDDEKALLCPFSKKLPDKPVRNGNDAACKHVLNHSVIKDLLGSGPTCKCPLCPAIWTRKLTLPDHARAVLVELHRQSSRAMTSQGGVDLTGDDDEDDEDIDDEEEDEDVFQPAAASSSSSSASAVSGRRRRGRR